MAFDSMLDLKVLYQHDSLPAFAVSVVVSRYNICPLSLTAYHSVYNMSAALRLLYLLACSLLSVDSVTNSTDSITFTSELLFSNHGTLGFQTRVLPHLQTCQPKHTTRVTTSRYSQRSANKQCLHAQTSAQALISSDHHPKIQSTFPVLLHGLPSTLTFQ